MEANNQDYEKTPPDSSEPLVAPTTPVLNEAEPIATAPEIVPSTDENRLHASLAVAAGDIQREADLDLNALPSDFRNGQTEEEPPKAEDLKAAMTAIMQGDKKKMEAGPEGDALIAPPVVMKSSIAEKIKHAFYTWWDNRVMRYVTLALFLIVLAVILFVPIVRTTVFNTFGVRSTLTVTAIDQSTLMPLKNVVLKVGEGKTKTNDKGFAKLYDVRLGKQEVSVAKPGFKEYKKTIDFGMRTQDLGEVTMTPQGIQFELVLLDYLSGKPVKDAEVSSGEATTRSDKEGLALLTVPPMNDSEEVDIEIAKKGYRTEKITLPASFNGKREVKLVVAQRAVFINKASGKFDVYKMYVDGAKKELLLAGTGRESGIINVLPDPEGKYAALVSTRDERRNKDGYLLSALTIINIETGDTDTLEHAEQIVTLGWRGSSLIYLQTVAGSSAANPNRQKIIAYDYATSKRNQLASANYFGSTVLSDDTLYYQVTATDPDVKSGLARVDFDGTDKKQIYEGDVWSLLRADYQTVKLQTPDKWYEYKLGTVSAVGSNPAATYVSKMFVDAPDGKWAAWIDPRDSRGVLMAYDIANAKSKEIVTERGLSEVAYWLGDRVVAYRTIINGEVNEYAVSIDGGEPKHISEVSSSYQR